MKREIIIGGTILVFICGCGKVSSQPSQKKQSATPAVQTGVVQPLQKKAVMQIKGELLAQVEDWAIGVDDFNEELEKLKRLEKDIDINDLLIKKTVLESLINNAVLAREAEMEGVDKEEEAQRDLNRAKRDILAQRLAKRLVDNVVVSDEDVKKKYEETKNQLRRPEERKVREIVLANEDAAKGVMLQVLKGEDFATLARDASIAESKDKGGDLGYIRIDYKDRFDGFLKQVFTMEKGATSSYFKSPKGQYYIIKVEDIKGGDEMPFDEVKDRLKSVLQAEKVRGKIKEFKQKMKVVENPYLIGVE